ncbi:LCP family protein [Glutamicibacter sp. MNS18]|uniref:LCP family glycopolymer transferase n=1 Tax=Glutamicibacter sp. MNS18 TaxID=2989817 RepID=UPI00223597B3|nr:LCP family protein [Glutamicibacter sp. MNS18]MCW4465095.1 LCP family protein [Glutamicibacter sp. MNS18]
MGSPSHRAPSPLRHPETLTSPARSKRALILVFLTIVFPGSAQLIAGNRRLGRFVVSITMLCWLAILALVAIYFVNYSILLSWAGHPNFQLFLIIALSVFAVGWLLMFLNTLVIIKPSLLAPGMIGIVTVFTLLAVLGTSGIFVYGAKTLNTGRETIVKVFDEGPAFDPVEGRYNIAIFGADSGSNRDGIRTDSIALLSVDAKTGKSIMISVPRNFQNARFSDGSPMKEVFPAGYNCGNECLFNAIYREAEDNYADRFPASVKNVGAQATMDALEGSTGLDVQGYVMVDMAGFESFVNAVGGVDIISGGWVPYNAKKWEGTNINTHWFAPGLQHFDGKQALWFARSRDFTSDYHRIKRQQCLQQALIAQITPQNVLNNFTSIMDAGEQLVETDIPANQLGSFVSLAEKARKYPFERLTLGAPDFGTAADRFSTYPQFDQIEERINGLIAKQNEPEKPKETKSEAPAEPTESEEQTETAEEPQAPESTPSDDRALSNTGDEEFLQPDGSAITEKYLVELERYGATNRISQIAANNDECSVP